MTIYPPRYADHGLDLDRAERFTVAPKATFITVGHAVDTDDRRIWLTGTHRCR